MNKLSELDKYPYTGHAVIVGQRDFPCQEVQGLLAWFGDRVREARREYRRFVAAGFDQGRREDLRGGGLIRSAGGRDKFVRRGKGEDKQHGDERILGSSSFVEEILEEETRLAPREWTGLKEILHEVCDKWGIQKRQLLGRTKIRSVSRARREFFLKAHEEAGESMASLARLCGLAHTSVRQAIEKARKER